MRDLASRLFNRARDALFAPGTEGFWARRLRGRVMCLLYHRVDDPDAFPFLGRGGSPVIPPEGLRRELGFLQSAGASFLTFRDVREGCFPGSDEFGVIVSFDDGFRDNYTHGSEVLGDLGIEAVFFQSTAFIDAAMPIWEHQLYWFNRTPKESERFADICEEILGKSPERTRTHRTELVAHLRESVEAEAVEEVLAAARDRLDAEGPLSELAERLYPTASQVRRAHELGHEIGSHGHHHYKRSSISDECFRSELERSARILEHLLGEAPRAFSYPFNSYARDDDRITGRFFAQAATVDARLIEADTPPLWMPRFTWPGSSNNPLRVRRWLLTGRV